MLTSTLCTYRIVLIGLDFSKNKHLLNSCCYIDANLLFIQ
ncbi:hypothetical protein YPPY13_3808 [Yersinia pestis PY-13]|uniref:Uncharacterized protein n=2 Tax=Yersinia pestis TaxID=632 RepID=A0AAV3BFZ0_YERPE|nr:hypothetical protein YPIP275_4204 [Yersinia pestis biovar Orientalis str. IP275]EDR39650.1 hypothetical protein YpF1991016_2619 [Yersinia pestis biovar Orientalis str. F1991016]EDR43229.1 hypothetical protein YpE1979001_2290 [Yersinia pestis biovar Antiqua str. E1979001]EDR50224.1 hypothetical protein YpB42003004_3527 [Yersinia pestis biovar Antiqua str. B42003004]EDR56504.1 hypothetical protein YpMG051020_1049 [Yersinia pestis biovar Orientalis str. MG05-1020]EDR63291.1 hypothetical protei